ncbi:glycosyl transferase family 2 [Vulcanisaeta moutnovskia 768-28]|uniref:Glycosyl transferase family 2 n=1 Tax=Vulcanisaeta moutnovskia (strain 768-28) TaxID=985053 RepID=F0QSD2_VULM7|nr:glycosyltransferase family 2 protein [Vulcanisaeta moutnovskia]ADY00283.1 glycosyl transferase family 2 [Vulcanisaeta moutnovskia 768-28]
MKVLIGVPTYNNSRFGYSIRRTLESLASQSFRDFRVLVVYKPSPGDRTLDVVDEFRDKLDIEVKIQSDGYFEEALNIIYEVARDYDITLTTDDDAIPLKTWVEEHITMHKNHEKIGVFTELINDLFIDKCNTNFPTIRHLLKYYKPLLNEFNDYQYYINDVGLLACNDNIFDIVYRKNMLMYYKGPIGVNMSFKSKFIDDFKLPGATIRGLHNEQLLMLHYLTKYKMHSVVFKGANVNHAERDSLARPKDLNAMIILNIENALLPYMVTQYSININVRKLEYYSNLVNIYSIIRKDIIIKAYNFGLKLAIEAIKKQLRPKDVRTRLIDNFSIKNLHGN